LFFSPYISPSSSRWAACRATASLHDAPGLLAAGDGGLELAAAETARRGGGARREPVDP
jgi:hypothetical protein